MKYKFHPGEAGILVEIFLPKKTEYQGTLYKTLEKGLNFNYQEHFLNFKKVSRIQEMIKVYTDISEYDEELITNFQQKFPNIFAGYSMYEVDGVFKSWEIEDLIYEERTQVIKVFFIPNYEALYNSENLKKWEKRDIRDFARRYFKNSQIDPDSFKKTYNVLDKEIIDKEGANEIIEYLNDYINCAGLFVFGYILFEISEQLLFLLEERRKRISNDPTKRKSKEDIKPLEEEIWVTSVWGFTVNKVKFKKA